MVLLASRPTGHGHLFSIVAVLSTLCMSKARPWWHRQDRVKKQVVHMRLSVAFYRTRHCRPLILSRCLCPFLFLSLCCSGTVYITCMRLLLLRWIVTPSSLQTAALASTTYKSLWCCIVHIGVQFEVLRGKHVPSTFSIVKAKPP